VLLKPHRRLDVRLGGRLFKAVERLGVGMGGLLLIVAVGKRLDLAHHARGMIKRRGAES
jgi:hypothetical protein